MRVLKFGGAALRDGAAVRRAVEVVRHHGGRRPTVVVSAHEGVTERLEEAARGAGQAPDEALGAAARAWDALRIRHRSLLRELDLPSELLDRELRELRSVLGSLSSAPLSARMRDHVVSFGERMSARVVAASMRRAGLPATPVDAFDLGLVHVAGRLDPPASAGQRVRAALAGVPGVPVVTGFLAIDREGHLTTLGRNGSDLSATWLGAALGAEEIQLWKCVPGLLTADPRHVPEARLVPALTWEEAALLAFHGARALHSAAVEPARAGGVPILLRDVNDPQAPGSRVSGSRSAGRPTSGPLALAHRAGLLRVRPSTEGVPGSGEPYLVWRGPEGLEGLVAGEPGPAPATDPTRGWATIALVGQAPEGGLAVDIEGALELDRARPWEPGPATPAAPAGPPCRILLVPGARLGEALRTLHARCFGAASPPIPNGAGAVLESPGA